MIIVNKVDYQLIMSKLDVNHSNLFLIFGLKLNKTVSGLNRI